MGQSKIMSLVEACSNQGLAIAISLAASFVIYPLLGIRTSAWQNIASVLAFSVVSIARSYAVRRFFEHKTNRAGV